MAKTAQTAPSAPTVPSLPLTPPTGLEVPKLIPAEVTGNDLDTWSELDKVLGDIDDLTARAEKLKERLRRSLGRGVYTVNGRPAFSIVPNNQWSEEQAREILPAPVIRELTTEMIDRATARKVLGDAWYRLCQRPVGKDKVVPARRRR